MKEIWNIRRYSNQRTIFTEQLEFCDTSRFDGIRVRIRIWIWIWSKSPRGRYLFTSCLRNRHTYHGRKECKR